MQHGVAAAGVQLTDQAGSRGIDGWLAAWIDVMLIAGGFGLLALRPTIPLAYDAFVRYQALVQFIRTGHPTPMQYSFLGPLGAAPLWYLGDVFGPSAEWWVMRYNLILFALLLVGLWVLLRNRLERATLRMFLLGLVGASMFGIATQDFLGEMFTAVLVGLGLLMAATRRGPWGWLVAALGTANTPAAGLGLALAAAKWMLGRRRLRYLVIPVVALALIFADTWFRRHELLVTGYVTGDRGLRTILPYSGRPGFSYPVFLGLLSVLLSFGKGLFFFAPGLLLPVRGLLRRLDLGIAAVWALWLTYLAGMILVYSTWWAWYGGFTWGPRFFLLASLPASLALAVCLRHPPRGALGLAAVSAALVLSCWASINGLVWGTGNLDACQANGFANEHLCWYVPEFSALWRPFVAPKTNYAPVDLALLVFEAAVLVRLAVPLLGLWGGAARGAFAGWRNWAKDWAL